ncbi:MAG: acyltransferase family protein [Halieaceae bacterium]
MKYRPEVDGLRAIAVLPVVIFHMSLSFGNTKILPGGFVGVDVFFVISGYLIASILVEELGSGSFSFGSFYERRARRILPALMLVLILCVPPALLWMDAVSLERFAWSVGAVSLFVSNILYWSRSGYFSLPSESDPLSHTWSLGVEEQFYLIFPVLLFTLWRWNKQLLWIILLALLLLSFFGAVHSQDTDTNFYSLLTRAWELLAGAVLAIFGRTIGVLHRYRGLRYVCPSLGLLMILSATAFMDQRSDVPGWAALVPVSGTLLILAFSGGNDLTSRLLKSGPIVAVGLISYSLYLWHQPMFAFLRILSLESPTVLQYLLAAGFAALGATLSYRLLEKPFRNRSLFRPGTIAAGAVVSSLSLVVGSAVVIAHNGFPERWSAAHNSLADYQRYAYKSLLRDRDCLLHPDQGFIDLKDSCFATDSRPLILWGDSLAASMYDGFATKQGAGRVTQVTTARCPPIIDLKGFGVPNCQSINLSALTVILETADAEVFLHANWNWYEPAEGVSYGYYQHDYWRLLEETLKTLSTAGKKVTVIGSFPVWHPTLPQRLAKSYRISGRPNETLLLPKKPDILSVDRKLEAITVKTGHRFISVLDSLCPNNICDVVTKSDQEKQVLLQWDSIHPTREGGMLISEEVLKSIQ